MQIKKYGIELNRLTSADLETVRIWRNADHVRQAMEYRGHIDKSMQERWFIGLNAAQDFYFIIHHNNEKAGVVNLKHSDGKCAEAGIFIGEKNFLNTLVPVAATLALMEFAFYDLELQCLKAKIATDNERAIRFNEALGYKRESGQNAQFVYYSVNKQDFAEATTKFRDVLK